MKTLSPLLFLIHLLLATDAFASDYLNEFERLKDSGNSAEIQAFLTKSAETEQENPDYYATAGNYWWQLSRSVSITTKPSEGDDFSVRDQKSGNEVGSISTVGQTNPEIPKRAHEILSEGARRFPHRADIVLGLAHVEKEISLQSDCVETLTKLLSVARREPESLRWNKSARLPSEASLFIPEAIQGYSVGLYRAETAESDTLCGKLCDATIKAFPEHPFAYNIKAALATAQGKETEALAYLEMALSKSPKDPLILLNLGDAYRKAGKDSNAVEIYSKVESLDGIDASLKNQARKSRMQVEQSRGANALPRAAHD
jgi:tetratricopeptide (TPR) repeat protein